MHKYINMTLAIMNTSLPSTFQWISGFPNHDNLVANLSLAAAIITVNKRMVNDGSSSGTTTFPTTTTTSHKQSSTPGSPAVDYSSLEEDYFALTKMPAVQIIFYMIYFLIFTVAVSGNSLVLYIVARNSTMQTPTNLFIANLAASDLIINLLAVPFTPLSSFLDSWIFGRAMCHLVPMVQGCSVYVSTLTLSTIAIDRYQVMFNPFETKKTKKTCISLILGIWCLSITLVAPLAVFMELKPSEDKQYLHCVENWPRENLERVYSFLTLFFQYFVPLCIIAYCYIRVSAKINERVTQKSRTFTALNRNREKAELKRKDRTNRMLIAMVAIFAFCWLPLNLIHVVSGLRLNKILYWKYFLLLFFVCHVIAMSSTCYNPMIYAWMNENFRKEFKEVLPCFKSNGALRRLTGFTTPNNNNNNNRNNKHPHNNNNDHIKQPLNEEDGVDMFRNRATTFRCAVDSVFKKKSIPMHKFKLFANAKHCKDKGDLKIKEKDNLFDAGGTTSSNWEPESESMSRGANKLITTTTITSPQNIPIKRIKNLVKRTSKQLLGLGGDFGSKKMDQFHLNSTEEAALTAIMAADSKGNNSRDSHRTINDSTNSISDLTQAIEKPKVLTTSCCGSKTIKNCPPTESLNPTNSNASKPVSITTHFVNGAVDRTTNVILGRSVNLEEPLNISKTMPLSSYLNAFDNFCENEITQPMKLSSSSIKSNDNNLGDDPIVSKNLELLADCRPRQSIDSIPRKVSSNTSLASTKSNKLTNSIEILELDDEDYTMNDKGVSLKNHSFEKTTDHKYKKNLLPEGGTNEIFTNEETTPFLNGPNNVHKYHGEVLYSDYQVI